MRKEVVNQTRNEEVTEAEDSSAAACKEGTAQACSRSSSFRPNKKNKIDTSISDIIKLITMKTDWNVNHFPEDNMKRSLQPALK